MNIKMLREKISRLEEKRRDLKKAHEINLSFHNNPEIASVPVMLCDAYIKCPVDFACKLSVLHVENLQTECRLLEQELGITEPEPVHPYDRT